MRQLEVQISGTRVASVLTHTLSFFGSLATDYHHWKRLLESWGDLLLENAAESIVAHAVPEIGEPHPQRAAVIDWDSAFVSFLTPGGVTVTLYNEGNGTVTLVVGFGRDSEFAARCLIGRLYESSGGTLDILYEGVEELVED